MIDAAQTAGLVLAAVHTVHLFCASNICSASNIIPVASC